MRTLITLITTLSLSFGVTACNREEAEDSDPCDRAIRNAERLARENPTVSARYAGASPLTRDECDGASKHEISCAGYASDWNELERCSPALVR